MDDTTLDDMIAAMNRETMQMITRFGHQVISVFPTTPEEGVPFSYTVGRTGKGRPELLITGPLDPRIMGHLLNDAAYLDDNEPLQPGSVLDGLLRGYPVQVVKADPYLGEMFQAFRFYDTDDIDALQLVWPDQGGHFPGDPGYDYPPEVQPVHRLDD